MVNVAQAPAPDNGYVPNEKTAIQMTKAVLEGMQGKAFAESQKPFEARLENGIWNVEGRVHHKALTLGGGGVEMRISQRTGEILGYYFAR